jgi:hypothetical protein
MFRTIQTVAIRGALVVALTSSAACSLEHDPGLTEDFVRAVRAEGLADGYGDEKVTQMFEDLCVSGVRFEDIQQDYPIVKPDDFPRMDGLASEMCN